MCQLALFSCEVHSRGALLYRSMPAGSDNGASSISADEVSANTISVGGASSHAVAGLIARQAAATEDTPQPPEHAMLAASAPAAKHSASATSSSNQPEPSLQSPVRALKHEASSIAPSTHYSLSTLASSASDTGTGSGNASAQTDSEVASGSVHTAVAVSTRHGATPSKHAAMHFPHSETQHSDTRPVPQPADVAVQPVKQHLGPETGQAHSSAAAQPHATQQAPQNGSSSGSWMSQSNLGVSAMDSTEASRTASTCECVASLQSVAWSHVCRMARARLLA